MTSLTLAFPRRPRRIDSRLRDGGGGDGVLGGFTEIYNKQSPPYGLTKWSSQAGEGNQLFN